MKTDPRFKKATSGAKKAAAAVKDAAKGDANTKEGFDAAVVSSGEENAAKIQTAKKADQVRVRVALVGVLRVLYSIAFVTYSGVECTLSLVAYSSTLFVLTFPWAHKRKQTARRHTRLRLCTLLSLKFWRI